MTLPAPVVPAFERPFFEAYASAPRARDMFWGFDGRHETLTSEQIAQCRATYCGLAVEVDHHIGRLLEWLEATDQRDEILIILTADHGEILGDLGLWGKLTPFRTASHVPLIHPHPDISPNSISQATESIDVVPTVLSAFGAEVPFEMPDKDLLQSTADRADGVMVELELGSVSGQSRFETAWSLPPDHCRAIAFEKERHRSVHLASGHAPMFFDVRHDPDCTQDLSHSQPKLLQKLIADLWSFRIQRLSTRPS